MQNNPRSTANCTAIDRLKFWLHAAVCALLACSASISAASDTLVMGIFPRFDAVETNRMFQPLARHLSTVLGKGVVVETAKDFESFWSGVAQKRYDLVHFNQYHYLKSHKDFGYQVIAKNIEQGEDTLGAAILVRSDSNIQSIADLKGKKVIFGGDRRAMQAYVIATYLLRKGGLKKGDYVEEFSKNPPNAVMATYFKQADAAGAGDHALKIPSLAKQIDAKQMRYLATSEPLPHLPWAVTGEMSRELRAKIQLALINLNKSSEGKVVLARIGYDGFTGASNADYDKHRQIIKEVLGEEY